MLQIALILLRGPVQEVQKVVQIVQETAPATQQEIAISVVNVHHLYKGVQKRHTKCLFCCNV